MASDLPPEPIEDVPVAAQPTVEFGGQQFTAAPTRRRGRETVRDMVISLALVGLGIAVLWALAWRPTTEAQVRVIEWQSAASAAARSADYPIVVPEGLSPQWRATSARFEPEPTSLGRPVWHLGFVTPQEKYAGLEQSDADPAVFVGKTVDGGQPEGEVTVAGDTWQVYGPGRNGYRSLVRSLGPSTVIVTGSAAQPELEQLAASLTPYVVS